MSSKKNTFVRIISKIALGIAVIPLFFCIRYAIKTTYQFAGVGDTVFFGKYEQSGFIDNGPDNIEWIVLAKEEDKLLLISKKALFNEEYCSPGSPTAWDKSDLREVLNTEFYDCAFSEEEKQKITSSYITAEQNPYYDTDPGKATKDKVFVLSISEAEKYFLSDADRYCTSTWYQYSLGSSKRIDAIDWWLRTPGKDTKHFAYVAADGSINYSGEGHVYGSSLEVRPAIWLSIK